MKVAEIHFPVTMDLHKKKQKKKMKENLVQVVSCYMPVN